MDFMKRIYYVTFEKGYEKIVEKFIMKCDKVAKILSMYQGAALFSSERHFSFTESLFLSAYLVLDRTKRAGAGSMNAEMKHLLEEKDFKISIPKSVKKIKLTYVYPTEKVKIDQRLKVAFETMLSKKVGMRFSFYETDMELSVIAKEDGECFLAKKLEAGFEIKNIGVGISPQKAFALNFLSSPKGSEVSLDPFADSGMISFVRAKCFDRANVIAAEEDFERVAEIKKLSKKLKTKAFSVLGYNFLADNFPIRFIDKIVTCHDFDSSELSMFLTKLKSLGRVTAVICLPLQIDQSVFEDMGFTVRESYTLINEKIFVIK